MSRTLEKTLTMLLPTASGGIPKELMDYASSVLNQSRNRISNLNSSEEPAREMICAHLACDRMKQKLGLPSITKPPAAVPPKIYNILYKQFSEALFPSTSGATANKTPISTPKNNRKIDHQQQLQQGQNNAPLPPPLCPSPTKRSSSLFAGGAGKGGGGNSMSGINSPHKPSAKNLNTLSQFVPNQKLEKQLPSTAYHTMISDFCNTFQNPQLVSHIVSGFNFISNSFKYSPLAKNPYALIGALYIVIYQLTGFSSSSSNSALKHGTTEQRYAAYLAHRKRVVEELGSYLHGFSAKEFESLIRELLTDDMRETPWWRRLEEEQQQQQEQDSQIEQQQGIQKTSGEQKGQSIVLVGRGRGEGGEVDAKQIVTLPRKRRQNESGSGVGSMMQDKVNYLSEKRRNGYIIWKERIMDEVERVELTGV